MGRLNKSSCLLCGHNFLEKLKFSRFPADKMRRTLWLEKCGLDCDTDISKARLCSKHFKKEDFEKGTARRRRLKCTAFPSLFPVIIDTYTSRSTGYNKVVVRSSPSRCCYKYHEKCLLCNKNITAGRSYSRIPKDEVIQWEWSKRLRIDPIDSRLHSDARICDSHIIRCLKRTTIHQRAREYALLTESGCANTNKNDSPSEEPVHDANLLKFNRAMGNVTSTSEPCVSTQRNFNNESAMKGVADASTETNTDVAKLAVGIDNASAGSPPATRLFLQVRLPRLILGRIGSR